MKTLNFIVALIALLIMALSELQANNDNGNPHFLSLKVKSLLKTPALIKEKKHSEKITVYFSVDEQGNVNDVFIPEAEKEVKKDLEEQFRHFNFKGLQPCIMNSVVLNFVMY